MKVSRVRLYWIFLVVLGLGGLLLFYSKLYETFESRLWNSEREPQQQARTQHSGTLLPNIPPKHYPLLPNTRSTNDDLPLNPFSRNVSSPNCCPSEFKDVNGCLCLSSSQRDQLLKGKDSERWTRSL